MFVLDARYGEVQSLAFSPDSGTLCAAHRGSWVHVWNLADRTARPLSVEGKGVGANAVVLPGGRWVYGTVVAPHAELLHEQGLLDLRTGADYPFDYLQDNAVAISPDGSRIFSVGLSHHDKDRPELPRTSPTRLYGRAVTADGPRYEWHQDYPRDAYGAAVGSLGADRFGVDESVRTRTPPVRKIVVRRATDGRVEHSINREDELIEQLVGSPDGTKLVARQGTKLWAWDATNWKKPPAVVEGKYKSEMRGPAACFHPSAPYLLLANGGPSVVVFDTTTWKPVRKWKWDTGGVLRVVAVSSDGTLAAAGGPRGIVVVWDLDL